MAKSAENNLFNELLLAVALEGEVKAWADQGWGSGTTQTTQDLVRIAVELLRTELPEKHRGVRLVGMGVSHLATGEPEQGELFLDEATQKQRRIDAAADLIASKYGGSALKRGGGMAAESSPE